MTVTDGNSQSTPPNTSWGKPLTVRILSGGKGIAGVPVTFSNEPGSSANIVNPSVVSDADGYAKTGAVSPNTTNLTVSIRASMTATGSTSTTFKIFTLLTRSYPDTPTMTLRDPITSSTTYAQQLPIYVNISPISTAAKWCLSESQSSRPPDGSSLCAGGQGPENGWYATQPTAFTLTSSNGAKSVYIWVADQFNQVSLNPSPSTIFLDTVAPGIPTVLLSDPDSGSTTDTSALAPNISVSNDSDSSYWCMAARPNAAAAPTNPTRTDACWTDIKATTIALPQLGLNKVYVWTKDLAGNVSPTPGVQTINFTTAAISDPTISMFDSGTLSTVYTRSPTVTVNIGADVSASRWCISETQTFRPPSALSVCTGGTGPYNGWTNSRPSSFTLSGGDGLKTVFIWTANPLNHTSTNPTAASITVDTIPPAIPIVDVTDPNTGLPNFTNQSVVNLSISGDTDATSWCVVERASNATPPSLPNFNNACWVTTRPSQVTLAATGTRRIYVYTKDVAQNVAPSPAVSIVTYSTAPPANPVLALRDTLTNSTTLSRATLVTASVNSPTGTTVWCLSETQTTRPANGTSLCSGGAGPNNGWYTSSPSTFTLSNGDGLKTVYVWVADSSNNVNSTASTSTITLDLTPPSQPLVSISDPNSGSTTATNQVIATLSITNDSDAARWCRIIQDPALPAPTTPLLTDVCWVLSRPTTVVIDQAGIRKLYVYTRDTAGNIGASGTAIINYSTTPPNDPVILLSDIITGSNSYATQRLVNLAISGDSDANLWCVSELQVSRPALGSSACTGGSGPAGSNHWSSSRPTTWTLSSGDGAKRLYVWTANTANTVNANPSSTSVTLDTVKPNAPTTVIADANTGSTSATNQNTVSLSLSGESADVAAWCVIEQSVATAAPAAPIFNNACWLGYKPITATLAATGNRAVYVYEKDTAGNVSIAAGTASIQYLTAMPAAPTLALADPTTGSASYIRQAGVNVSISGDGSATSWCLSSLQSTRPPLGTSNCQGGSGPANGWFTARPNSTLVPATDGLKTVYLWTADSANNVSSAAGTAAITLDTLPPAVPFVALSDITSGSTSITNQTPVGVNIQYDTDAVSWCLTEQAFAAAVPSVPLWNNACWNNIKPVSSALGATGVRRVFVYTKDVAGNISPAAGVSQINYSTTPPVDPVLSLTNATTGLSTYSKDNIVTVAIVSPTGTQKWCLSETQATRPSTGSSACAGGAGTSSGWYVSLPSSFTLSAGDGLKTVYVWVADSANNTNANASSATIQLDQTAPATPSVTLADANTGSLTQTNQSTATLSITADTDAYRWCAIIQSSASAAPSSPSLADSCWRSTRPTTQQIDATGLRTVYVFTRDLAGNVGSAGTASITYSTSPPSDPVLSMNDSVTGLSAFAKQTAMNITITGDTNAVKWCVSEAQTTRPLLGTATCTGATGPVNGWFTARPTTLTLSSGEGLKRVYVWTADISNNVNGNGTSVTTTLDQTPPLVPSVTATDPNTGSSAQTNQSVVNVSIGATSDALAWCVIEQAAAASAPAAPAFSNACFNTTKPNSVTLSALGARSVFVFTRDQAYNVSTTAGLATLTYSTTAPAVPTFTLSDAVTSSTTYARQLSTAASVSGDTAAIKWCISETQSLRPAFGTSPCAGGTGAANGWLTTRPVNFVLSSGDGLKSVYLWTADLANNTSASAAVATISLDTVTPSIPVAVLSDQSTGNTAFTNSTTVNLSITGDTNATAWCVIEQAAATVAPTTPLFNNACFNASRPTTQTLGASGSRKVYVYTKDIGQNVSVAAAVASISLSTTPPSDPALVLSNATTGSRLYTNSTSVSVSINNPAGAVMWCLSETQTTRPTNGTALCTGGAGSSNGWYTTMPPTFSLSATSGLKTVYIWVADASNNTNANSSSTSITLLQVAPAPPTVSLSDPNTNSSSVTNQSIINLVITADSNASAWCPVVQDATATAPVAPSVSSTCWLLARPTSISLGATGNRTVYVFLRDPANNVSTSGSATINYSTTAAADPTLSLTDATTGLSAYAKSPVVNLAIGNDASAQLWCVSETQSVRPSLGTSACLGGAGSSNGWSTTRPTALTLSGGDGLKTIYIWVANSANNVSGNTVTATITHDTVAPVAPSIVLSDANNGSTSATNQSSVNISFASESADVGGWCALERSSVAAQPAAPLYTDTCWVSVKPTAVTLSATGTRKLYVYERDLAENVSATAAVSTIQYSVSPPVAPSLAVADPTTGSLLFARQSAVVVAVTGDTGAVKWCLSEQQSTQPSLGSSACIGGLGSSNGWYTTRPTSMTLSSTDGIKTLYLWTADFANNVSLTPATVSITLDTLAPAVPFVTLSDITSGSSSVTNQTPAGLSVQFDTDAVKWCVIEQALASAAPAAPLWNNACWITPRPVSVGLAATGVRRVFVYTKDIAGNVSPAAGVSQINYTTTPPTDPVLSLNNASTGSTIITKDLIVTAVITSPTGAAKWCLSELQTTRPSTGSATCVGGAGASSGWSTSLPNNVTLSSGDGLKTVYIWVADAANNVNANVSTTTITLDTAPPATPTISMTDPNSNSTTQTNQISVNLSITGDFDSAGWCPLIQASAAAAPSAPGSTNSCWRTTKPTTQVIDATGSRTLYVFTRDAAGNIGNFGSASITYSTTPPNDPVISIADSVTALTDFAKQAAMNLSITGDTGAVKWCVSESQSTHPTLGTSVCTGGLGGTNGWYTTRPTTFTLSAGEALKRIYVWTADINNNVNSNATSVTITLDQTAPLIPTAALSDPNSGSSSQTNQATVNLAIGTTADALAWCVIEQSLGSAVPAAPGFSNSCFVTTKPTTQSLGATGSRAIYVYTRDRAYNVSTAAATAFINYSTTGPVTPTLSLTDPATSLSTYARQLSVTASVTGDTGAVKWCLSETQTTRPLLGTSNCAGGTGASNGWLTVRPNTFSLSSGDALKTVYLWAADVNNNTTSSTAVANITLDTVTPSVPAVSLSDPNTGNTAFTNLASVSLSITWDTNATAWCVIEQASATVAPSAPLFNNACFVTSRPSSQALATQGSRKIYVYTKDISQNISVAAATATITLSTSAPSDPVLVLSNSTTGSRAYTSTTSVAVSINNPIGAVKWCLSETQSTRPTNGTAACTGGGGSSNGWYTSMPSTISLSSGDALKTVYIWVADNSNNTNQNASSTTITLLQTAPVAPTVGLSDPNTNSTTVTNQNNVTMTISGDSTATAWCALTQAAAAGAPSTPATSSTCWVLTRPTSISLGATGSRSAYVFLRDAAMNVSAYGTATIALSTSAPADPTISIADVSTALTTYAKAQVVNLTVANDATAVRWCVSETQTVQPTLGTSTCAGGAGASSGWYTTRPTSYTLSAGDGAKRVYIWIANSSNNVNVNSVSQATTLDTVAPGSFTVSGVTGGGDVTADQYLGTTLLPTINWTAASGANSYNVLIKNAAGTSVVCAQQSTSALAYTFAACTLTDGMSYTVYVTALDAAQNVTNASNFPFTFTVNLTPPGAFTISGVYGSQDVIADQWAGTSLPTVSWSAASNAASYIVQILAADGVTVLCPAQIKAAGVLAHDYSTTGCSTLANNTNFIVQVSARDVGGNVSSATNNSFTFHTDLTPPAISITSSPPAQATASSASFGFTATDTISGVSSVQCQIDSGTFGACNSTTTQAYSGLTDGSHNLVVSATDRVGFSQTASYNWAIDTVAPNSFSILGATGPTDNVVDAYLHNDSTITANWSASSNATSYQVTILNMDNSVACTTATEPSSSTSHYFAGCTLNTAVDYQIKVVALRGYGTNFTPTPMQIHPYHDTLTATITTTAANVKSGLGVTLSMVVYQNGTQMTTGGLSPSFSISSGSSTGTFGSVAYIGSGTYTATFTGGTVGTAAVINAASGISQAFTSVTTTNVTVIPGNTSAATSTFVASKALVSANNTDTATLTLTLRDINNNLLTGQSPTAAATGGTSTGVISAFTEVGNGVYTFTFSGRVSGSATTITATNASVAISTTIGMTVQPGIPIRILATGPATFTTQSCAGPFNATLRDYYGNLAQAQSNVQINFAGLTSGNFSLSNTCSTTDIATTIYLGGSTMQPVYVIARAPAASASFSFSDNAATLTQSLVAVAISGIPGWLGTSGGLAWGQTTGITSKSNLDGLQTARGVWVNSPSKLLYVVDANNHRIVRYDMLSQAITGWIGRINSVDGIAGTNCTSPISGNAASGWCTGGSSQISAGTNLDGMFNTPVTLVGDGTYLYILDTGNARIARVVESTGAWAGWYGRVNGVVSLGGAAGCSATTTGNSTPGWCTGGTSQTSGGTNWDGGFNNLTSIEYFNDPTYGKLLFIADTGNHRIVRLNINSGSSLVTFDGWSGRVNVAPTSNGFNYTNATACSAIASGSGTLGWCKGGTSQASPVLNTPVISSYDNMYNTPRGLSLVSGTPNLLYLTDVVNSRIVRLNVLTGVFDTWAGRVTSEFPASGGTGCNAYNTDTLWCTGGVPIYSGYCFPNCPSNTASTTAFRNVTALHSDGTYVYTADNGSNDYSLHRFAIATPNTYVWAGRISTLPTSGAGCSTTSSGFSTPNWCGGGNSRQGFGDGHFTAIGDFWLDSANDRIYTADQYLSKVQIHAASTGANLGWIGATASVSPLSWSISYSGGLLGNIGFAEDLSFASGYGVNGASGIGVLGSDMYVVDTGNYRVKHYNASTGGFLGWYGRTNAVPTGPSDSCTGITSGAVTPTWCVGGSTQSQSTQGTGELNTPRGIASDGNYLYIVDSGLHRIVRLVAGTASFAGWLGRTGTSPTGMSGYDATGNTNCPAAGTNVFTNAWCAGGNNASGAGDGQLNTPYGVAVNSTTNVLYVADTSNNRLSSYNSVTGAFLGWLGRVNSTAGLGGGTNCSTTTSGNSTPAFCTGGSPQVSAGTANFSGFSGPRYVAYANSFIFVTDTGNNRVHKFDTSGTYYGWIGRVNVVTNLGTGTGCAATASGNPTPAWCTGGSAQATSSNTSWDNQFNSPNGIWADNTYLYVVDTGNERITKHLVATGAFVGWRGIVGATSPTGGDTGCAGTATGSVTPGWCTGGTSRSGRALGGFQSAYAISGDANFIYITDSLNNRVVSLPK